MHDHSVVQIDLSAIEHNMRALEHHVGPDVGICPIVKADAYGLGAERVSKRLATSGAEMLAVYTIDQAAELARSVPSTPVLVLMPVWSIDRGDELYRSLIRGRLHLTVHGLDHLEGVLSIAERFGSVLPLHVEVDTGMNRGGVSLDEVGPVLRGIAEARRVHLAGLFTHFASAETDPTETKRQMGDFEKILATNSGLIPEGCVVHAANSAATLRSPRYHHKMVRVGIAWIGIGSELLADGQLGGADPHLKPALTWLSSIVHIKTVRKGKQVGYGGTWTAPRKSRIAMVPVGYADGYPMTCGSDRVMDGPAMVQLRLEGDTGAGTVSVPVVGAVSMNQLTIDITRVPTDRAGIGTEVELISPDRSAPSHLTTLAHQAGTKPHEMLCRISPALRRVYQVAPRTCEASLAASIAG